MSYRVAIIGAGASGLTAIKCCLEEGLQPVCFERRDYVGGLWHFTPEVGDGRAIVTRSTVVNTSKEMMAYSDFPPPKEYPPYPSHYLMDEYLNLYADKFHLRRYVRLKTEVLSVEEATDHALSGRWVITVKDIETGKVEKLTVNSVLVCTGPFSNPYTPDFEGIQSFKGRVMHSYEFIDPTGFDGKRVVVVGFGNTALDVAADLSRVAKQVYLSNRGGSWLFQRIAKDGMPLDFTNNRVASFLLAYFPGLVNSVLESRCNAALDHERYGLCPQASPTQTNTVLNDDLAQCLINGRIKLMKGIIRFTGNTVVFSDGRSVDDVDVVVMATGYRTDYPFLDKNIFGKDITNLYKATFPPDRKHPTLAVIGCYRLLGPLPPCAEMQCRVATRVFKGLVKLPTNEKMIQEIERRRHIAETKQVRSKCFIIQLHWMPFMNELAPMIGVQPSVFRLLLTDWRLARQVVFGTSTPYQFRLQGPGAWEGAREALMTQIERTFYSLDQGTGRVAKKKGSLLGKMFRLCVFVFGVYHVYQRREPILTWMNKYRAYLN